MSWDYFRPYVSVGERRRLAIQAARKLAKKGRSLAPVELEGRTIARTFWGKAWCTNLESYSDYMNRLPRGRTYVRNGSVIDLQMGPGSVDAIVQGSDLYTVSIRITELPSKRWKEFIRDSAGKITNLLDLLQGRLSEDILSRITAKGSGLFPAPKEIKLRCSCPDWADMCKHVAAVLYGVGSRLDESPELFFTLRGGEMQELVSAAGETAVDPIAAETSGGLEGEDLGALFGVELDTGTERRTKRGVGPNRPMGPGKDPGRKTREADRPSKVEGQTGRKSRSKKPGASKRAAKKKAPVAKKPETAKMPAFGTPAGKTGRRFSRTTIRGKKT